MKGVMSLIGTSATSQDRRSTSVFVEERSCGGRRHARPKADPGSILGRLFGDRGLSCTYRQELALRRGSVGTDSLLKLPR